MLLLFLSIFEKQYYPEYLTVKDYFSYWFLLFATSIIPLLVFRTNQLYVLFINLIPSCIGTIFYDRIHNIFGVGLEQIGIIDPAFYALNIIIALSYVGMVGFILNQRIVADKFEKQLYEQQKVLQQKNLELGHLNDFVHKQNIAITKQADQLKETNKDLLEAKYTIELQKKLLEEQNSNLESKVLKKTKDLSKINEELVISNNELRQFSHTLSHNLKSPVATFQGLLNLIDIDKLDEACQEILKYMDQTLQQMQMVFSDMNEVLELRNQLYTSKEIVDFQEQVDAIHNSFYQVLWRNNINLTIDVCGDRFIRTNKERLNGILYQVVSNAIKFRSQQRAPEIRIILNGNDEYHSIKVKDNGIGIDIERHGKKLFYPYHRCHHHTIGKGLGLYLAKLQTESLDGKINISSEVDKFTEVEILIKR